MTNGRSSVHHPGADRGSAPTLVFDEIDTGVGGAVADAIGLLRERAPEVAVEIRVLEMGQISSIADFLVIATGTSEPHLRALRIALEHALDDVGVTSRSESQRDSGWTVVDAFDVLFHVFRDDIRKSYALEALWKDGLDIPVSAILKA